MREDMFKVIVERPRLVNSNSYSADGRNYRDQEDTPMRLGMKMGYGNKKWLNENLAPLERFLEKQVGRPWDKIYSEIRAVIDARSTVKHHILQHLNDFVSIHTLWVENEKGEHIVVKGGRRGLGDKWETLQDSDAELYVHPRTGILCRNKFYRSWLNKRKDAAQRTQQQVLECRRVISRFVQLLALEGIWYEVELGELPPARTCSDGKKTWREYDARRDCVQNENVSLDTRSRCGHDAAQARRDLYGDERLYAKSKRQLSSKELKKHGVTNKALSGLVYLWRKLRARLRRGWTIFPVFGMR